jgi:amidophosphoribosyltransferase
MREVKGAYSTVLCTRDALYMFRDPHSIRPMVWGKMRSGEVVVASESCALDTMGVEDRQEIPPAGIVKVSSDGIRVIEHDPDLFRKVKKPQHCIFEHIYFSRQDSYHFNEDVYRVRERLGAALAAQDTWAKGGLLVPVPDSSNFIRLGYSNASGFPSRWIDSESLYRENLYQTEQTIRDESVRQKFNGLPRLFRWVKPSY